MNNNIEGRINAEYDIDEIVEYRQEMIAKVGILTQIFELLEDCIDAQADMKEEDWATHLNHIFKLPKSESNEFENVLELIFETLYTLFINNTYNQMMASKKIELMQQFVFVPNISKVLIAIFKDKQFEMNKKEIHTEILYRRIYEYERFQPIVESFVEKLRRTKQDEYIYILRKICVIDGNPLPLIQREIFKLLYENGEDPVIFGVTYEPDGVMVLLKRNILNDELEDINVREFNSAFSASESNFILDQLALEADICFGRNKYSTPFFKERFPVKNLIQNMTDENIPKVFRASLIRLFTSIYIDDHPHSLMKMSRCFKAYQSADNYMDDSLYDRSPEMTSEDLDGLFQYINHYFYAFAKEARGPSFVKAFEMELVKCCKFMLKFGIFTHRNEGFQINDIDDLFSFL